jgi:transposase
MVRPNMRFVSAKGIEHQDLQAVHRIRQRLIEERTALVNQIRGLLAEFGIIIGKGINQARAGLPVILEDGENGLTGCGRELFNALREELIDVDERIAAFDKRIAAVHAANPLSQKLAKVEGVGAMTATAFLAAVVDAKQFANGRQCAAWVGLVPRQDSSGGKTVLLGISKRGDRYLRAPCSFTERGRYCGRAGKRPTRVAGGSTASRPGAATMSQRWPWPTRMLASFGLWRRATKRIGWPLEWAKPRGITPLRRRQRLEAEGVKGSVPLKGVLTTIAEWIVIDGKTG